MHTLVSSSRIPVGSHDHTESCAQRERLSGPLVSAENHMFILSGLLLLVTNRWRTGLYFTPGLSFLDVF